MEQIETKLSFGKQEPVMEASLRTTTVLVILAAILAAARSYGANITPELEVALVMVAAAIVPSVFGILARMKTTPMSNPRTMEGERLVPEGQVGGEAVPAGTAVGLE